jgi:hypothetical protein
MQTPRAMTAIFIGAVWMAATVVVAGTIVVAPRPAIANPAIAQKTGQPCTKYHTAPPTLNAYGKKYKEDLKK